MVLRSLKKQKTYQTEKLFPRLAQRPICLLYLKAYPKPSQMSTKKDVAGEKVIKYHNGKGHKGGVKYGDFTNK